MHNETEACRTLIAGYYNLVTAVYGINHAHAHAMRKHSLRAAECPTEAQAAHDAAAADCVLFLTGKPAAFPLA
jgi:hypothetical protein